MYTPPKLADPKDFADALPWRVRSLDEHADSRRCDKPGLRTGVSAGHFRRPCSRVWTGNGVVALSGGPELWNYRQMDQYLWVLNENQLDLIRELEPARITLLDEDGLLALHKRIRRARNKYRTNYRRKAAGEVEEAGGRGAASNKSDKARARAYVFEEALSIVSAELSRVAHDSAEALKDERLERARAGKSPGPETDGFEPTTAEGSGRARSHQQTTGGMKRDASSRSQGAQRQAKRDLR